VSVDELPETAEVDGPALVVRTEALTRFVIGAERVLPAARIARARALAKRAGDRLQLSGEHTVVALAGATGSGKSSLFNALARMELSTVGVRRPTTAHAFACVWGPFGAAPLLDWLEVAPERRFSRESVLDAEDEADLRGLVLLDLPDFDSLAAEHRVEVDRLLRLVDLVVWVTDPQKYADQVIHDQYLRAFRRHGDVTVVVLNQADRLGPADTKRCVADLAGLLASDGLPEVPVFAVSATSADPGSEELRAALKSAVTARRAGLRRLAADLDEISAELADLVDGPVGPESIDRDQVALLADALAAAAGVPAVVGAAGEAYRQRARWALRRIWGAPRRDPVAEVLAAEPGAGQEPARRSAARAFAEPLADRLPAPWATALTDAVKAGLAELPDQLGSTVAGTEAVTSTPWGWPLLGALRWLAGLGALAGAGWLAVALARNTGLLVPVLLVAGGLAVWLLVTLLSRPLMAAGIRAARGRADRRLRAGVLALTREHLVAPVRVVLTRYAQVREALRAIGH
jgi:GTP-binding protein EngB required for normal cell division